MQTPQNQRRGHPLLHLGKNSIEDNPKEIQETADIEILGLKQEGHGFHPVTGELLERSQNVSKSLFSIGKCSHYPTRITLPGFRSELLPQISLSLLLCLLGPCVINKRLTFLFPYLITYPKPQLLMRKFS